MLSFALLVLFTRLSLICNLLVYTFCKHLPKMSAGRPPSHIQTINSGLLLELPTPRKETPAPGRSTEQREADHEDQNHALTQPDGGNSQLICPPNTKLEEKFMRTQTRQSQRSSISSTHSSTSSSSSEDPYYELILSIHELLRSFQTHLIDLFDTFGPEAFPLVVRIARVFDNLIQKSRETDDFAALSRIKVTPPPYIFLVRSSLRPSELTPNPRTKPSSSSSSLALVVACPRASNP